MGWNHQLGFVWVCCVFFCVIPKKRDPSKWAGNQQWGLLDQTFYSFYVTKLHEHFSWIPWILFTSLSKNTSIEQDESLCAKNLGRKLEGYVLCTQTHDRGWLVIVVYSCLPWWKFQWSFLTGKLVCHDENSHGWVILQSLRVRSVRTISSHLGEVLRSIPPQVIAILTSLNCSFGLTKTYARCFSRRVRTWFPDRWRSLKTYPLKESLKPSPSQRRSQTRRIARMIYIDLYILLRRAGSGGSSIHHGLPLGTARHLCHTAAFFWIGRMGGWNGSVSVSLHASPQKGPVWAKHSGGMQIFWKLATPVLLES